MLLGALLVFALGMKVGIKLAETKCENRTKLHKALDLPSDENLGDS